MICTQVNYGEMTIVGKGRHHIQLGSARPGIQ